MGRNYKLLTDRPSVPGSALSPSHVLFYPHSNPVRWNCYSPVINQGTERLHNLPEVTQADSVNSEFRPRLSGHKPVLLVTAPNSLLKGKTVSLWGQ